MGGAVWGEKGRPSYLERYRDAATTLVCRDIMNRWSYAPDLHTSLKRCNKNTREMTIIKIKEKETEIKRRAQL